MHEFYDSIKNKTFVFDSKLDIFYNTAYNMLLKEKNPKVKDNFNSLMTYYTKYINVHLFIFYLQKNYICRFLFIYMIIHHL
jgi:hypothetical protein